MEEILNVVFKVKDGLFVEMAFHELVVISLEVDIGQFSSRLKSSQTVSSS